MDHRRGALPLKIYLPKPFKLLECEVIMEPLRQRLIDLSASFVRGGPGFSSQHLRSSIQQIANAIDVRDLVGMELQFGLNIDSREQEDWLDPKTEPVFERFAGLPNSD
jgi:hypothetical protein